MLNKQELLLLEELINDEISRYLQSGYKLDSEYVVYLRIILDKLGLKDLNFRIVGE